MIRKKFEKFNRKTKEKGNFSSLKAIRSRLFSNVNLLIKLRTNAQNYMINIYPLTIKGKSHHSLNLRFLETLRKVLYLEL